MPFSRRQPLTFPVGEESAASSAEAPPPPEAPAAAAEGAGRAVSQVSEPRPPTLASTAFSTADRGPEPPDNAPYWVALAASVAWIVGVLALAAVSPTEFGARGRGPVGMVVSLLLAAAPLGFVWAAAFAVAQARGLLAEARRARRVTDGMTGPVAVAAAETGTMLLAMRAQIHEASEAAAAASDRLALLHQALADQTGQLTEAASHADRTATRLVERLSSQRGELNTLAVTLDARAAAVTDAINRQARMVADASDLAETQLREAEACLAARAADLGAAAAEATDASRTASEDLARQIGRLETAGLGVGDQLRSLEDGLTQQRAALVTVAHTLRAEQEDFASLAETRTSQLSGFLTGANRDVVALNEVTSLGARSMSELVESAAGKFRELADAARTERELFGASAASSLNTLSEIGANERRALEEQTRHTIQALSGAAVEAREAADAHAEAARSRVEQLNEAAFAAGQRADQVFEARLGEARGLIAQSARLVEEAGASTADKLGQGVAQARSALAELKRMVDDVGADAARLPAETEARAAEIHAAVAKGVDRLLATARRTAEETQAIDTAFQERVKRNYEMLSEAVQLMGVVARGGQETAAVRTARTPSEATPTPPVPPARVETAAPPLRPRLKLTPAPAEPAAGERVPTTTPSVPASPGEADAPWSWKGLLTAVDGGGDGDAAAFGGEIIADIAGMGIDPAALLSKSRIEEIAAALQTGDAAGAREVVRGLAPAAARRLSRRMIADGEFRAAVRTFQGRYAGLLNQAAGRDPRGFEIAALLARDAGRAYLLIDAATGDTA